MNRAVCSVRNIVYVVSCLYSWPTVIEVNNLEPWCPTIFGLSAVLSALLQQHGRFSLIDVKHHEAHASICHMTDDSALEPSIGYLQPKSTGFRFCTVKRVSSSLVAVLWFVPNRLPWALAAAQTSPCPKGTEKVYSGKARHVIARECSPTIDIILSTQHVAPHLISVPFLRGACSLQNTSQTMATDSRRRELSKAPACANGSIVTSCTGTQKG